MAIPANVGYVTINGSANLADQISVINHPITFNNVDATSLGDAGVMTFEGTNVAVAVSFELSDPEADLSEALHIPSIITDGSPITGIGGSGTGQYTLEFQIVKIGDVAGTPSADSPIFDLIATFDGELQVLSATVGDLVNRGNTLNFVTAVGTSYVVNVS